MIFGFYIAVKGDAFFKKVGTAIKPHDKASVIVTDWPFSFSRNPMYLGFILFLLGLGVLLGSVVAIIPTIIMFLILQIKFIPMEEKSMESIFGQEYLEYKHRIRRWI